MVFLVGGANSAAGYEIENSVRFNDGDSPSMTIASLGSSSSNAKKWTVSFWAKLSSGLGAHRCIFSAGESSGGEYVQINFTDGDELQLYSSNSLGAADNTATNLKTNAKYRDVSAWYHVVYIIDFTDGTAGDRIKLYVNGERVTSFASSSNIPAQNTDNDRVGANNIDHFVGKFVDSSSQYFDGYLSDLYFIDGDAKAASDFGETNDNGVWIPIKYTGSFGNNGFKLEFQETGTSQNSSGIGADTSGNDHHMAVTNLAATDITTDTPSNNFATMNPLSAVNATLSEGNVEGIRTSSGSSFTAVSTIAPSNGKWYFEYENTGSQNTQVGVVNLDIWPSGTDLYNFPVNESCAVLIEANANYNITFAQDASNGSTLQNSVNLVTAKYGFAVDIDNNDLYVSANGNWYTGSAFDDTDFSNATAVTTDLPSNAPLAVSVNGSLANTFYINFGNPGGDDSISSGNADANGYGNFEYAVPSGYYALCTKNLAEYG